MASIINNLVQYKNLCRKIYIGTIQMMRNESSLLHISLKYLVPDTRLK